ncbi:MAG: hypothetical protein ACETWG_11055 [Candidatus Neomarinimicrobiota bacterium]
MRLVRIAILISLTLALCVVIACKEAVEPEQDEDDVVIYFNSFESPADTAGWWGYGDVEFRTDTPPQGGNQSLFVSGTCIVPHFRLDLLPADEERYLKLRCWGKNLAFGGGVSLSWFNEEGERLSYIDIYISDSVWTAYETEDTLLCPANETPTLNLNAGGIVYSAMLVDLVEVIRIK